MNLSNLWRSSLAVIALSGFAVASPASDLLEQGIQFMTQNYHGYSAVKPLELGATLKAELERACGGKTDCAYSVATPFLNRLASGMRDGHTFYLSPSAYEQSIRAFTEGGATPNPVFGFQMGNANSRGEVLVADVIADSPAFKGGLRPFDRIVSVNGETLQPSSAATKLRAQLQTDAPVTLEVARGDATKPVRVTVRMQRAKLERTNLPFLYQPANAPADVLVMRFPTFVGSNDIAPRAHELVAQAQAQGAKHIVIDVRGNGGGEETECYGAASAFIGRAANINETTTQKVIVGFDGGKLLGNDPKDPVKFDILKPTRWTGGVSVLVDDNTASCGELMAYFMQFAKRGQVIGEQTVGVLDTATEYWKLLDGSALAITYVRTLNEDGTRVPEFVTPDIAVSFNQNAIGETGRDAQLEKALETLGVTR
jgi:carboxyl-terminal processing protease